MKIAVIAANGRSGQAFVRAALAANHSIHAGVHNPSHSHLQSHERLTIMPCDATKEGDLRRLLTGQDVVVSFIGHVKGSTPNVQTKGIQKVITVMRELHMDRIVSLTGTGVRFPGDHIGFVDRLLNFSISMIDPARVKNGKDHVKALQQSNLAWTIIRVLKLQNVPAKPFQLRLHGPTKWYVSRDDVAQAVLQVLEEQSFMRQAPIIGRR